MLFSPYPMKGSVAIFLTSLQEPALRAVHLASLPHTCTLPHTREFITGWGITWFGLTSNLPHSRGQNEEIGKGK